MFSIVVSSYNQTNYQKFSDSVAQTIGVDYEIIQIENPKLYSISKAYNLGANRSKYQNIIFCHEDVIFENSNWGQKVSSILNNKNCGVVGVAGSTVKSEILSGWSQSIEGVNRFDLIQMSEKEKRIRMYFNPLKEQYCNALCLDGVFMAVKKEVWENNKFDEQLITGYHCYDLDFCIEISKNHQNYIAYELGLVHFSMGEFDKNWLRTALKVHKKHKTYLENLGKRLSKNDRKQLESNLLSDYALMAMHFLINKKDFMSATLIFRTYFTKYLKPKNAFAVYKRFKSYL